VKTFNDNSGRTWTVSLNIGALKRVRSLCEVDLMAAVEGKLVERLVTDPVLLCDVLFAVCAEEAEKKGVTDEEFGRSLAGDAIDAGTTALLEELVDFFPKRRREVLRTALRKMDALQEKSVKAAMIFIQSPVLDRRVDEALAEILGRAEREGRGESAEMPPPETSGSGPVPLPEHGPSPTSLPVASV
jgi:hypothetical protein